MKIVVDVGAKIPKMRIHFSGTSQEAVLISLVKRKRHKTHHQTLKNKLKFFNKKVDIKTGLRRMRILA